jgi:hypothetical protein
MPEENENTQNKNQNLNSERLDGDLPDSPHDEERMQSEEVTLNLPDVKDIPGQEFIHPPKMESFSDTTISSADEEGDDLFEDEPDEDADLIMSDDENVSEEEKSILENAAKDMPTEDNSRLRAAGLDDEDSEGDTLNEASSGAGGDLDTSGVDDDDAMENIGAEDEENNTYSLGGDSNDNLTEGKS